MASRPPARIIRTDDVGAFQPRSLRIAPEVGANRTNTDVSLVGIILTAVAIMASVMISLMWGTAIATAAFAISAGSDFQTLLIQFAGVSNWLTLG